MPSFPLRFFFRLITLAVMCALTLPVLVQDGMFMDAMLYTSVSHNLAQGIGTFWFPQFSASLMAGLPSFHEQPPLVFGIQSLFFKALGSGMFVERVYAFITMLLTASLIVWLWRRVQRDAALQKMEWLPVLLWITIPVCFWSFQNNMHENTMGLFVLLSAIAFYRSFQLDNTKIQLVLFSVLAGVFVFLATFSKGIPGLFPLAAPALYWLATRRISFRRAFVKTALAVATVASIYGVLLAFPDSRQSLQYHFVDRALHRINQDPTVDYRLYIIVRLVQELAVPIALSIVCYLVSYRKRSTAVTPPARLTIFFLLLGFAGSAPLLLTMVQKGFYFVPSLPFFAIGFAVWIAPVLMRWIDARKFSAATIGMLNG
ncbi:MAG TPA: glycosyltransferase family 39 protein, partial [Chitinophagales bacterium]|nr:glycosyltransferase family 39 protein [Chitinophagales bacterium]